LFAQLGIFTSARDAQTRQSVEIALGIVGDRVVDTGPVATQVLGALVIVVTQRREVAGPTATEVLGALVVVVALLVGLTFRDVAVIPAVFLAGTAKQVFQSCDGALILFVGCEVARRHA
jgi:hypothetical protein